MRSLLILLLVGSVSAGFFDFLSGKKEEVHVTAPDTGELGANIPNGNLGRRVGLGKESRSLNRNEGDEIVIPVNGGGNKTPQHKLETTTRPLPRASTPSRAPVTFESSTPRIPNSVTRTLPSDDLPHKDSCPWRVDAFTETPQGSLLFDGYKVYFIQGTRVISSQEISVAFPRGPRVINAAVYDKDKDLVVLFKDRQVFGFKKTGSTSYEMDSSYPKDLPESIAFTPNAAIRWHDEHQMLLSSGGMFALYDEYWNKSLMTGRTSSYFKGLPDRVRGTSFWNGGRSTVFTQNLVYTYDQNRGALVDDGVTLGRYLQC